ncbi:MAG: DUF4410 domain-containing protein [Candidatus Binataceae bacterium]
MKLSIREAVTLLALVLLAGCASTTATSQTPMVAGNVSRPNMIWVYPFVASPSEVPADSSLNGQLSAPGTPMTAEEEQTGHELGAQIATQLVTDINLMGLAATLAAPGSRPQVGDGVIRGYLVSVDSGGTVKRFMIGFGAGASELDTVVEGFEVTPQGWRKLGQGTLSSSGNKTPGMAVPAVVAIATGSPVGVIVMGGLKVYGEASGRNKLEGRAKATADEIAAQLKTRFQARGWVS